MTCAETTAGSFSIHHVVAVTCHGECQWLGQIRHRHERSSAVRVSERLCSSVKVLPKSTTLSPSRQRTTPLEEQLSRHTYEELTLANP